MLTTTVGNSVETVASLDNVCVDCFRLFHFMELWAQ